jgi:hypothetical protein
VGKMKVNANSMSRAATDMRAPEGILVTAVFITSRDPVLR